MLRRLRVLAAFFMLPILIGVTPQSAAVAASSWTTVNLAVASAPYLGDSIPGSIETIDCRFSLIPTGQHSIDIGSAGRCIGLPDVTWGYAQPGEAGSGYRIDLEGLDGSGASCGGSESSVLGPHSLNGTLRVAGSIPPSTISTSGSYCALTEVCITLSHGETACQTVDMAGAEEPPEPTTCQYGTVTQPQVTRHELERDGTDWGKDSSQYASHHWRMLGSASGSTTATEVTGKAWVVYYVYPRTLGATGLSVGSTGAGGTEHLVVYQTVTPGASAPWTLNPTGWTTQNFYSNWPGTDQYPKPGFVGVGAFRLVQDVSQSLTLAPTQERRRVGITDASQCSWYWGTKIATPLTGAPDSADPVSPMGALPDPGDTETPVEPVIDNPDPLPEPDEDTGFLGPMWALLDWLKRWFERLWQWIQDLGNWLKGLVVPDSGYLEGKWSGVDAKWASTTPAKYVDEVASFSPGSVSGCSGVPLQVTLPGGVGIDERLGAACSGPMASSASVVRAAITAMVVVGGAFACVRAVGSGLGWNPGVGRSET